MSIALPELDSLEHLDFEIPCEYSAHKGEEDVAEWRMAAKCPACQRKSDTFLCNRCKDVLTYAVCLQCPKCMNVAWSEDVIISLNSIK